MRNHKDKPTVSLEELLRLKRNEQPSGAFWDSFESTFHRRRLNALVERETRRSSLWSPILKAGTIGFSVAAMVVFSLVWPDSRKAGIELQAHQTVGTSGLSQESTELKEIQSSPRVASGTQFSGPGTGGQSTNQFVVDAITDESAASRNFRKVLYSPAIHISAPTGSFYVRDNLSPSTYQVTTANLRLGRNF